MVMSGHRKGILPIVEYIKDFKHSLITFYFYMQLSMSKSYHSTVSTQYNIQTIHYAKVRTCIVLKLNFQFQNPTLLSSVKMLLS